MQVSSRDGQEMLLTSIELGDNSPSLQSGPLPRGRPMQWRCNGAATLRFPGQRMVLFFGQIFRLERTLT